MQANGDAVPLQRGDRVPHFEVTALDGRRVQYGDIWQRRNLVLVVMDAPGGEAARAFSAELTLRRAEFDGEETVLVCTAEPVRGVPPPAVLIADRWGEIVHTGAPPAAAADVAAAVEDVFTWVRFLQIQCPECPP